MKLSIQKYSFRFADQVLNGRLAIKDEVERIFLDPSIDVPSLSRPAFNKALAERFLGRGWHPQPHVFGDAGEPAAKMDFLKDRVGVEVGFSHQSFIGIDLLKFQVSSYSALDKIDVGVYVETTQAFQRRVQQEFSQNWQGSLTFEGVVRYLPHLKSAIQVPIYVLGIDL